MGRKPGYVVQAFLGHGLFHHHDSVLLEPEDFFEGLGTVLPTLVGVHCQRNVRHLADGLDHGFVRVQAHFDLEDIELADCLQRLFLHHFRRVYADREGCGRSLRGIQSPDAVPGLSHKLPDQIVQGDVDGGFRGGVSFREAVHVGEDVFHPEGIGELREVHLAQEGGDGLYALPQVRRHRGFSVTGNAFVFDFHLHVRGGGAAVTGNGEDMGQFELVGEELQVKFSVPFDDVELLRAAAFAAHQRHAGGRKGGCPEEVASILHNRDWLEWCLVLRVG